MSPEDEGSPEADESTDIFPTDTKTPEEYPCLQQISSPGRGSHHRLFPGKNIIGRSEEADVSLDDSSVSREHVELDVREGGAIVRDLGSRNGTLVEGQRISGEEPITHNQRLKVGSYDFQFLTQAEPLAEEIEEPPDEPSETPPGESPETPADEPPETPPAETPPEGPPPEPGLPAEIPPEQAGGPATIPEEEALPPSGHLAFLKQVPTRVWLIGGGVVGALFLAILTYNLISSWLGEPDEKVPPVADMGTIPLSDPKAIPETAPVEQPEYIPVFLEFSSTPISGKVFFGDENVGTSPFRMSAHLQYGKVYEVRASFTLDELGETIEEKLRFSLAADQQVIPLKFAAPIGHLKVGALPRGVELYLEGVFAHDPHRAKPIKFNEIVFGKPIYLPFGDYTVELKRSRRLQASKTFISQVIYRREFKINQESTEYEITVQDKDLETFPLKIVTEPEGADCLVDGEKIGLTPFEGTLPLGEHTLVLRKEGYFEHTQPIRVELNTPYLAEIALKTSEAGRLINEARVRIKQKRYKEAIDLLVNALREKPIPQESAEGHYLIGQSFLLMGEYGDARDHFLQGMKHELFRYSSRLGIAQIYFSQGERIRALQVLIEVLVSAKQGHVKSEAATLFQQISPFKSVLYVTTEPEGAQLTVNGKEVSQATPLILHDLMVGTYRLQFSLPGYQGQDMKIDLGVSEFKPILKKLKIVRER